jgi:arylsulfatase A
MDDAFGLLMRTLAEQKLDESTLVWFTSDNGPAITNQHPYGSAGPLRDKKGFLTEGGIRVPGIIRWPGKIKPATESDTPVCGVDFLPTVCQIVGFEPPKDRVIDGASIVPVFSGKTPIRTEPLYWHFNRAAGNYQVALRDGDWKILATLDQRPMAASNDVTEAEELQFKAAEPVSFVLYNLKTDIGETEDLAAKEPQKLAEMKDKLLKKYHAVRKESPTWPAWTFDNREGKRIVQPEYVKNRAKGKGKGKQ